MTQMWPDPVVPRSTPGLLETHFPLAGPPPLPLPPLLRLKALAALGLSSHSAPGGTPPAPELQTSSRPQGLPGFHLQLPSLIPDWDF